MTTEVNKTKMYRFIEFINTGDEVLAKELISEKAIFYAPTSPDPIKGPLGYISIIELMRSGFPDVQWALQEMVAEGDVIAARFILEGTHRGMFFGIAPTGKKIKVQALNFYYFSDGKIIKEYGQPDLLGLLHQIGGASI